MTFSSTTAGTSTGALFFQSFSNKGLPKGEQFDAWRSVHAGTIELLPTQDSLTGCEAEFSSWSFGDIVLTRSIFAGAPMRRWLHRPKSYLDHWCVVLARGSSNASLTVTPAATLSFRSLALPFEGEAQDAEVLTLFLPRDICRDENAELALAHGIEVGPGTGALLAGYMEGLVRQLPHIGAEHGESLAAATRSLVSACIVPRADRAEAASVPLASALVDRARLVVHQNMASPQFGPDQLARILAVSRSKLYRLFENTGGVAHFINGERLREAHRRLTSHRDTLSIHVIGTEVGFLDHSTFSRAFRREFGYSPTEARENTLARMAASHPDASHAVTGSTALEPMAMQTPRRQTFIVAANDEATPSRIA